jgi:hypothetical protein
MLRAQSEFGGLRPPYPFVPVRRSPTVPDPVKNDSQREAERARRVERLVDAGASRLTAERIVAIERGAESVGRARRHAVSHR